MLEPPLKIKCDDMCKGPGAGAPKAEPCRDELVQRVSAVGLTAEPNQGHERGHTESAAWASRWQGHERSGLEAAASVGVVGL